MIWFHCLILASKHWSVPQLSAKLILLKHPSTLPQQFSIILSEYWTINFKTEQDSPKRQHLPLNTHTHFLNPRGLSSTEEMFIFWTDVLSGSIPFLAIKTLFMYDMNNYYYCGTATMPATKHLGLCFPTFNAWSSHPKPDNHSKSTFSSCFCKALYSSL